MIDPAPIFKNINRLKELYPDDAEQIEQWAATARELIDRKRWSENDVTMRLVSQAGQEILKAQKRLATDRRLVGDTEAQRELWFLIESRQWFVEMASSNYEAALTHVADELERELKR